MSTCGAPAAALTSHCATGDASLLPEACQIIGMLIADQCCSWTSRGIVPLAALAHRPANDATREAVLLAERFG